MNRITNPLALLIATTEDTFMLERGDIHKENRSQPVASIRMLAMAVARHAGFSPSSVARAFKRDRSTVANAMEKFRVVTQRNDPWWPMAKAILVDAWHEKLYPQNQEGTSNERRNNE